MTPSPYADLDHAEQTIREAEEKLSRADYPAADALFLAAQPLVESHPRQADVLAGRCRVGLGRVRNAQSRFDEARALVEAALPSLANDPLRLAVAFTAMGEIIANQGDLSAAMAHYERAYTLRRERLGRAHPDTLDSLSMLALFHHVRGEKNAARDRIREAVAAAAQYQGAPAMGIALVYRREGFILMNDPAAQPAARAALEHALAIFRAAGGSEHPDFAIALNNLANLHINQKRWGEARDLLLRSLSIHERAFGPQSAFTHLVLGSLSDVEKHLDNLEAAYHYAARALVAAVRGLGARSPQALAALRRLVIVLGAQSRAGNNNASRIAVPFHICLVALEVAAGKRDPKKENQPGASMPPEQAAARLERLVDRLEAEVSCPPRSAEEQAAEQAALAKARELAGQGDAALQAGGADRACALYTQALQAQEALLGPNHLDHIPLLQSLARASEAVGRPSAILPLMEREVAINSAVLGEDHPETLMAMNHLYGRLLFEYGQAAARPLYERIRGLMEQGLGPDDPFTSMLHAQVEMMQKTAETPQPEHPRQGPSRSERIEAALRGFQNPSGVLSGLEQIDWHAVTHAYGPADDVPRYLKMLLSPDAQVRETGWEELMNSVWHQGTLYPATAVVAPFMIRLLEDDTNRLWAMDTLAGWAESSSYQAIYSRPGSQLLDRAGVQERIEKGELGGNLHPEVLEQVNRAVAQGLPKYLALLDDPDDELRLLSLFTLSRLRDREAECIPAITARLVGFRGSSLALPAALYALRALFDAGNDAMAFFTYWMSAPGEDPAEPGSAGPGPAGPDPAVTFQAAAGVIERAQEFTPEFVVDTLLSAWPEARKRASQAPDAKNSLYSMHYQTCATTLEVLANLGIQRHAAALSRALPLLQTSLAGDDDLLNLAGVMLDLLFYAGQAQEKSTEYGSDEVDGVRRLRIHYGSPKPQPPRDPARLSGPQRSALVALLGLPAFWRTRHNLLALYGLPESREGLQNYLEEM